jgi:hypothetical protein
MSELDGWIPFQSERLAANADGSLRVVPAYTLERRRVERSSAYDPSRPWWEQRAREVTAAAPDPDAERYRWWERIVSVPAEVLDRNRPSADQARAVERVATVLADARRRLRRKRR